MNNYLRSDVILDVHSLRYVNIVFEYGPSVAAVSLTFLIIICREG